MREMIVDENERVRGFSTKFEREADKREEKKRERERRGALRFCLLIIKITGLTNEQVLLKSGRSS